MSFTKKNSCHYCEGSGCEDCLYSGKIHSMAIDVSPIENINVKSEYKKLCHHCKKANDLGAKICTSCKLNLNTRPNDLDLDDEDTDYYEAGFMNDFGDSD